MTINELLQYRICNQQLHAQALQHPESLVAYMGAMQAQDYAMAKWGIGLRSPDLNGQQVEDAVNKGNIIRLHILRPTWHFVTTENARWMMELSASSIQKAARYTDQQTGLTTTLYLKARRILEKILEAGDLTREEIMEALAERGVKAGNLLAAQLLIRAETEMLICSGKRRDRRFTYTLFDKRVAPAAPVKREEALARLATCYFKTRGPATLKDFAWWAGLTTTDAARGWNAIQKEMMPVVAGGTTYWMYEQELPVKRGLAHSFLLPPYDELTVSYSESRALLFNGDGASVGNGIFRPVLMEKQKITGIWKRTEKKNGIELGFSFLPQHSGKPSRALLSAVQRYEQYTGKPVILM
ncbi:winged helix DNA-binding domain-containing protein [Niabella drilacis]|uniref:Winged helix DNA-binding domain-containing protein n=1 Tax=Niabella drilacis (strain DSM 25811 / CCM 8410 / CCUG 62505 / LMG 26954 / E90) TaxID=1285928 RepID=A0A1G6WAB9_NIADE|nr:winged helix DNA-binding domain-containing protein [Niabella drilacis]SDD62761.1 Winged helix DNA-binding domain-containing protein [Niabella drilacis]